jgi:hypothetical protein
MNVLLNTHQIEPIGNSEKVPTVSRKAQAAPAPAQPQTAAKPVSENSKPLTAAPILQVNVTLRRDTDGKIYYVFTDANTGKELREFPASEVRKAGQGVDELLKQEEQRAAHSLDTKA